MKVLLTFLILFGLDAIGWQIAATDGPEPRYINQMVFANNGLIVFGGKNSSSDGFNDLWLWENDKWSFIAKGATKRWDHSYTYMENEDQLFLFGGRALKNSRESDERIDLNDSWIYKGGEWKVLNISNPNPRSSHSMVFDANRKEVILFGGRSKEVFDDTWSFDGANWKKLEVSGPSKRYGHSVTYDPSSKAVYLFGGYNGKKLLNDLWMFNEYGWTEVETEVKPSPRMAHAMQFDNKGNAVLFGGWSDSKSVSDELWYWKDSKWTLTSFINSPEGRLSCAIGFNEIDDTFILFGGSTGFGGEFLPETWKLNMVE